MTEKQLKGINFWRILGSPRLFTNTPSANPRVMSEHKHHHYLLNAYCETWIRNKTCGREVCDLPASEMFQTTTYTFLVSRLHLSSSQVHPRIEYTSFNTHGSLCLLSPLCCGPLLLLNVLNIFVYHAYDVRDVQFTWRTNLKKARIHPNALYKRQANEHWHNLSRSSKSKVIHSLEEWKTSTGPVVGKCWASVNFLLVCNKMKTV